MKRSNSWRLAVVGVALLAVAVLGVEGGWRWLPAIAGLAAAGFGLARLPVPTPAATAEGPEPAEPYASPLFDRLNEGLIVVNDDARILFANQAAVTQLPALAISRAVPSELQACIENPEVELSRGGRLYRAVTHELDSQRKLIVLTDRTREARVESMRTDFVASASHELKTPAAAIRVTADALILALDNDPESAKRFAVRIEEQSERLADIVSDLLDLSRLETAEFEVEPCALDRIVATELAAAVPKAGVVLNSNLAEVSIIGSAADISLAVRNLVENALRYTESGSVDVSLITEEAGAVITVSDTGMGVPGRSLDRIFERFYRADKARDRASGGTGLGLSIVKHVAVRHGGSISVSSELGVGSTFELRLPFSQVA